jgi:2-hydroxy-6-oxonona-2,4-dienedioate hydrolase
MRKNTVVVAKDLTDDRTVAVYITGYFTGHGPGCVAAMTNRRRMIQLTGIAALAGVAFALGAGRASIAASHRRVAQRSEVMESRSGILEYAIAGHGTPFMMIHGTGGGFDQGLRFGHRLIGEEFQIVAPSRFGYLRSDFPEDPSPAAQADALADLLDHLEIDNLAVAGGSAGALTAAQFALRHPARCSHLVLLVPAANVTNRDPVEFTRFQEFLVARLLTSDAWFWTVKAAAPNLLTRTLLATDPSLLRSVDASERARAGLILNELMPISSRSKGMKNDGYFSGKPAEIDFAGIEVPTLILSAEDDLFGTAETARHIAAAIPLSRVVIYPDGGHIWLGRDAEVARDIADFVSARRG